MRQRPPMSVGTTVKVWIILSYTVVLIAANAVFWLPLRSVRFVRRLGVAALDAIAKTTLRR